MRQSGRAVPLYSTTERQQTDEDVRPGIVQNYFHAWVCVSVDLIFRWLTCDTTHPAGTERAREVGTTTGRQMNS